MYCAVVCILFFALLPKHDSRTSKRASTNVIFYLCIHTKCFYFNWYLLLIFFLLILASLAELSLISRPPPFPYSMFCFFFHLSKKMLNSFARVNVKLNQTEQFLRSSFLFGCCCFQFSSETNNNMHKSWLQKVANKLQFLWTKLPQIYISE